MDELDAFATVEQYEKRYGDVEDVEQLEELLGDATAYIASQSGFVRDESNPIQGANLIRVTCAVVHRAINAGGADGYSSITQSGVDYSATVQLSNPNGDIYLTSAEKKSLGIRGGRVGSLRPAIHDEAGVPIW